MISKPFSLDDLAAKVTDDKKWFFEPDCRHQPVTSWCIGVADHFTAS
jgi:hypothetical protein